MRWFYDLPRSLLPPPTLFQRMYIEMSINTRVIWGRPKVDARESRFQLCLMRTGRNWANNGDWFSFHSPKSQKRRRQSDGTFGYWLLLRKVLVAWSALEKLPRKWHCTYTRKERRWDYRDLCTPAMMMVTTNLHPLGRRGHQVPPCSGCSLRLVEDGTVLFSKWTFFYVEQLMMSYFLKTVREI